MSTIKLTGEYHDDVNMLLGEVSRVLADQSDQFIGELSRSKRATDEITRLKADNESLRKDANRWTKAKMIPSADLEHAIWCSESDADLDLFVDNYSPENLS